MGCSIHLCLERRLKNEKKIIVLPEAKRKDGSIRKELSYILKKIWRSCRITGFYGTWGQRHYGMFAKLANISNYWNIKPISELRGFPEDVSHNTFDKYMLKVVTDEIYDKYYSDGESPVISESRYNYFVEHYNSNTIIIDNIKYIKNPDYHSASWCTTKEMEECINEILLSGTNEDDGSSEEWLALLGAMKGYEMTGEYECRAVFWFDN